MSFLNTLLRPLNAIILSLLGLTLCAGGIGCAQETNKSVPQEAKPVQSAPVEQRSTERTAGHQTNIIVSNGPFNGKIGPNGEVLPDKETFRFGPSSQPATQQLSLNAQGASVSDPTARFTQGGFSVNVTVGSSTATPTGTLGTTFAGGAQTTSQQANPNATQTPTASLAVPITTAVGTMPTANGQGAAGAAGPGGTSTTTGAPTSATPSNTQTLPPPPSSGPHTPIPPFIDQQTGLIYDFVGATSLVPAHWQPRQPAATQPATKPVP